MPEHWFDNYRHAYERWWTTAAQQLDEDEVEDFQEYRRADDLVPVQPEQLKKTLQSFPALPMSVRDWLGQFGVGAFHFPDHDGDYCPTVLHFFNLEEAHARVESIREHAVRELEELEEFGASCREHGEDGDSCRAVLCTVRDNPHLFYPLFGPEDSHDFVYVIQGGTRSGIVSRWYHDYPVCELLDESGDSVSLDAYGKELVSLAKTGEGRPL